MISLSYSGKWKALNASHNQNSGLENVNKLVIQQRNTQKKNAGINSQQNVRHTEAVIPHKHIKRNIWSNPPRTATARTTRS